MIRHKLILLLLSLILPALSHGSSVIVAQNESIQEAIDKASPGDTILVYGGVHNESLIVNKSLQLLGIGMPEIGSGEAEVAVNLSAKGSMLSGFFINGSNGTSEEGIGIKVISNNNLIINNIIKNYHHGIAVLNSSHNILDGNTVQDGDAGIYVSGGSLNKAIGIIVSNSNFGIHLHNTTDSTIEGCNVSDNRYGIILLSSSNNTIADNRVFSNSRYGIQSKQADGNLFIGNSVIGNDVMGNDAVQDTWEGIYLDDSNKNTIVGCNISYIDEDGLSLKGGQGNAVIGSVFMNNDFNGIKIDNSVGAVIIGNEAWNNQERGFYISGCTDCMLLENKAANNSKNGMELNRGKAIKIIGNNASGNPGGISINNADGYTASDNLAFYNINIGIEFVDISNSTVVNNTASNNQIGAFLFQSRRNTFRENNFSENELIGLSIESGFDNLIAGNIASSNLAGLVLLNSRNNIVEENNAESRSSGIALQNSSENEIYRNYARYNKIGIYLNRSNDSLIEGNLLDNNGVGLAINVSNISNINLSNTNHIIDNEYNILRNENQSISNYQIWMEKIEDESMEGYLRSHEELETLFANPESFTPISPPSQSSRISTGGASGDSSPNLRVKIDSEPGGAEIWIDGRPTRAVTPSERTLDGKGYHDIELFLTGFEPLKETIYTTSSTAIKMVLKPEGQHTDEENAYSAEDIENNSDRYLYLSSNPEGASIWLDGKNTGKSTPDSIQLDGSGDHIFELFLSGYEIYRGEVNISELASSPKSINATLTARASGVKLPDVKEKGVPVPGFLSWQLLIAISLACYALTSAKRRSD